MDFQILSDIQKFALYYFRAPEPSFWKWAEEGRVIEWQNGKTICYREDLMEILKNLEGIYLPRLGSVLLLLAACQGDRKDFSESLDDLFQVQTQLTSDPYGLSDDLIENRLTKSLEFLGKVADLPQELKKGRSRIHLIQQLNKLSTGIRNPKTKSGILESFAEGQIDEFIHTAGKAYGRHEFLKDLQPLQKGTDAFREPESLENFLLTGLKDIPEPAELELLETASQDLLDQLAEDSKTYGMAQLAKRLIAALQIPMHTQGSSDQAFGGVSDISNRGELDQLLLSELAYDDDTLMARLVNNETLYYHHEEPPTNPIERRVILIDTTIKMWGVPRVMAISAALALGQRVKGPLPLQAFALGGKEMWELDLREKEGVLHALGQLDPALDCGDALMEFGKNEKKDPKTEYILITGEHFLHQKRLLPFLPTIKSSLDFLIEVGREGKLTTYQLHHGNQKKLNESLLNLEESLFAQPNQASKDLAKREFMPTQKSKIPLYLPTVYVQLKPGFVFDLKLDGVMAITSTHRWLYWPSKNEGAREILSGVPSGAYFWGKENAKFDSDTPYLYDSVFLLIYQKNEYRLLMYEFNILQGLTKEVSELNLEKERVNGIVYQDRCFLIRTHRAFYQMGPDTESHTVLEEKKRDLVPLLNKKNLYPLLNNRPRQKPNFGLIKPFINPGYSVFFKISNLGITREGNLTVGKKALKLLDFNTLVWQDFPQPEIVIQADHINKNWKDGSRAWVDNLGFLHLQSSDSGIPRVSIVLIAGKPTACFSADGYFCGSAYFVGKKKKGLMRCTDFYLAYIKAFLTVIQKHNAT